MLTYREIQAIYNRLGTKIGWENDFLLFIEAEDNILRLCVRMEHYEDCMNIMEIIESVRGEFKDYLNREGKWVHITTDFQPSYSDYKNHCIVIGKERRRKKQRLKTSRRRKHES